MVTIYAGNVAHIVTTITTEEPPTPAPTAVVAITTREGAFVATLDETVTVSGTTVTVSADWTIPDDQAGGTYIATIDTSGSVIAADEIKIGVLPRVYPS